LIIFTTTTRNTIFIPVTRRVKEYTRFVGKYVIGSACYVLSDESSIPSYSTSNGYKKRKEIRDEKKKKEKKLININTRYTSRAI